jgi:predicted MFS family arabinose efflux permease
VYWLGAIVMMLLAALLRVRLPRAEPQVQLAWLDMMRSIGRLVRDYPELREAAVLGALFFASFSAFWTTLVFLLQTPPYHYGSSVAGLFGLVGAAGALGAPVVGRMADRYGPRRTILRGLLLTVAAYAVLAFSGKILAGLIVGVLLLDLGVQAGHVSNQTRIYGLLPSARNRLNTVYMVSYFIGGAAGSYCGALCWRYWGWIGVCGFGIAALGIGLGVYATELTGRRIARHT